MSSQPKIIALMGNIPLLGQERANIETMAALRDQGCDVLFLVRAEHTEHTIQAELKRRSLAFRTVPYYVALRYGQTARVWWRNLAGIVGGSIALLRVIREVRPTHLHVGGIESVMNFAPALLLTRVPLVFRAGDAPARHHWLWRATWTYAFRRGSRFVCDSEFVRARLMAAGCPPSRTSVIHAPPPLRTAQAEAPHVPASSDLTVLFVGQITQAKGIHLLVDAVRRLRREQWPVRLLIAGDYSWNNPFALSLIDGVVKANLQEHIRFLGFVENIDALYAHADVHACPSLVEEAYGLTVVEAKSHGVPSIVFRSGALPEIVDDGQDGLVCPKHDSDALRAALARYLEQSSLAPKHGKAARESLVRLGVGRYGAHWLSIYTSCVGSVR